MQRITAFEKVAVFAVNQEFWGSAKSQRSLVSDSGTNTEWLPVTIIGKYLITHTATYSRLKVSPVSTKQWLECLVFASYYKRGRTHIVHIPLLHCLNSIME